MLGYLYATQEYCIKYSRNESVVDGIDARSYARGVLPFMTMDGFVDASYAGDVVTRRSATGFMFKILGEPVFWQSRLQSSVALSSMEAEYMAASFFFGKNRFNLSKKRLKSTQVHDSDTPSLSHRDWWGSGQ